MRNSNFFRLNPSGLLKLKELYQMGAMTEQEYIKFRKEALKKNVYKKRY